MEAATPLRQAQVRTVGDRVVVDGLVVEDECAVRLVREREQHGDDPVRAIRDAVEIGARVLDREQTGANAEYVLQPPFGENGHFVFTDAEGAALWLPVVERFLERYKIPFRPLVPEHLA